MSTMDLGSWSASVSAVPSASVPRVIYRAPKQVLVDAAMPPITRGLFRAREIWIDDALCRAARCRRGALRQRRVAPFVIVAPERMQANRISRIVRLGRRRPY